MPKLKEKSNENPKSQVNSASKVLKLLQFFTTAHNCELSINELINLCGWNRTTIYRFLQTLCESGYVRFIPETQTYRATFKIVDMASLMLQNLDVQALAVPYMSQLVSKWSLNCNLAVPDAGSIIVIHNVKYDCSSPPVFNGRRGGLYSCGTGKAIMSTWSPDFIESYLESYPLISYTPRTITNKMVLIAELQEIAARGYAVDRGEYIYSNYCIAAPIFNFNGTAIAAISVYGTEEQLYRNPIDLLSKDVMDAANQISEKLGYKGKEKTAQA